METREVVFLLTAGCEPTILNRGIPSFAGENSTMVLGRSAFVWLTACVMAGLAFPKVAHAQATAADAEPASGRVPLAVDLETPHGATPRELVKRLNAGRKLVLESNYAEGARLLQSI